MSAILVIPVLIPAAAVAWPAVAAAALAAAGAMGYAQSRWVAQQEMVSEVELPVENCEAVTGDMGRGEQIAFASGDVQVAFFRNTRGQIAVKVFGRNKTDAELRAIGEQMVKGLTQQYAYHRLMTELKERNFNVISQEVEEDGTVRLQVRTYQG